MKTITLKLGTKEYTLATTLRVAYVLQGMNNHKPYLDIFKEIDKLTLEKQVEFLYAAYTVAASTEVMSKEEFLNECLDNLNLSEIMNCIMQIIAGITGKEISEASEVADNNDSKN